MKIKSEFIKAYEHAEGFLKIFQYCKKHPLLNVIPKSIGIFKNQYILKKIES